MGAKAKPYNNNIMNSRTVGNIKRLLYSGCAPSISVMVETAGIATLGALITAIKPDMKEAYHQLRGHSLLCDLKGGARDTGYVPPASKNPWTRFFFDLGEAVDWGLYYIFLIDVVTDGLYNWSSQAIELGPCADPLTEGGLNGSNPFGACSADGSLDTLFEWVNEGPFPGPTMGSSIYVPPGYRWNAFVVASGQDLGGTPVPLSINLENFTVGTIYDTDTSTPYPPEGEPHRPAMVFGKGVNETEVGHTIGFKGSCGFPLADNEVFPVDGKIHLSTYR
jgi:hypothetical protein